MTTLVAPGVDVAAPGRARLGPLVREEYLRILRSRMAWLIWAMMVYAVAAVPFIAAKPPPEVVRAIGTWLGGAAVPAKVVLFLWVDASMNKFAMMLGTVIGGGIVVDERARGTLELFASKPIRAADYFTAKLLAAWAAMVTFYAGGVAGALLTFPIRVEAFDPGAFLALSAVHVFAALFAVGFAAMMAVLTGRRLGGMLASLAVLGMLVGLAFLGFYHPAYRGVSHLNPFFNGVVLIGTIDDFGPWDMARPIGLLVLANLVVAAIGRRAASRLLEGR